MKRFFYFRWIVALTLGELIGFLSPTLVGVIGYFFTAEGSSGSTARLALTAIGGLGEGAILGFAQTVVLRQEIKALSRRNWVLYTAIAAALAWILGISMSALEDLAKLGTFAVVLFFVIAIPVFLLSIGFAQWLELRKHVAKAWKWIVANAVAWPVGVMIPVITIGLVPDKSPVWMFAVASMIGGVLMGIVVGLITGVFLTRLLHRRTQS